MIVCSSAPLGDAFLLEAARTGDLGLVKRLVAEGHSVNRDSGSGDTPLSSAIFAQGADPCTINRNNEAAQQIAEKNHNQEFVSYLVAHYHCALPPRLPSSCADQNAATCVEVH